MTKDNRLSYTWDGLDQLTATTDGTTKATYTYYPDGLRKTKTVGSTTYKYGATVATYDYDPWGNQLSAEPTNSAIKGQPIRYAGYVYDSETKLYYLQARYYDPQTARFISRDPDPGDEDDPITMNGYTYAVYKNVKKINIINL